MITSQLNDRERRIEAYQVVFQCLPEHRRRLLDVFRHGEALTVDEAFSRLPPKPAVNLRQCQVWISELMRQELVIFVGLVPNPTTGCMVRLFRAAEVGETHPQEFYREPRRKELIAEIAALRQRNEELEALVCSLRTARPEKISGAVCDTAPDREPTSQSKTTAYGYITEQQ
jgi:hypothetical protein